MEFNRVAMPSWGARMHVVILRYTVAGNSDEVLRRVKDEFIPIIKNLPGLKAYHLVDCGGLAVMSIGFWESKVAATRSTEAAHQWVSQSAIGLMPFPPDRLEGDTVLDISRDL
jgi:heme-degrading monooxygenase HmoA